jgi:hypothetical protein
MAMTQPVLLFIGALATLATIGMFVGFADDWTGVVVAFAASLLWGIFGISSFDVILQETGVSMVVTYWPLVIIGVGFALMTGIFAIMELLFAFNTGASDIDTSLVE